MKKNKKSQTDGQKGVIIIFTMIILGILVSISLGLSAIFVPKIRAITEVKNSVGAFFAAESGLEWCLYKKQVAPLVPPPPVMANGATFIVTPADCSTFPLKSVGSFRGVNRALEVNF